MHVSTATQVFTWYIGEIRLDGGSFNGRHALAQLARTGLQGSNVARPTLESPSSPFPGCRLDLQDRLSVMEKLVLVRKRR